MRMQSLRATGKLVALPSHMKRIVILVEAEDFARMQHIVSQAKQEVQWFHQVERHDEADALVYRLYNTWVPPQYVGPKEVETDSTLLAEYYGQLEQILG